MSLSSLPGLGGRLAPRPHLYLHRVDGVDEGDPGRGRRIWIVSRGLCRFFKVPMLADAPIARQLEALRLQIERLSPFAETGSHFHFGTDAISLWLWDASAVQDAAAAIDIDTRRLTVLPEAAMQPRGEGIRLVECLDGVEGQCWEDGGLVASRWWPAIPDSRNWAMFQRGASVTPDRITLDPPPPDTPPWLTRSWTNTPSEGWTDIASFDLRVVAAGIAIVLLVGYVYLGAEWVRLRWDIAEVENRVSTAAADILPITSARSIAVADEAAIKQLQAVNPYPGQLALMARVASIMPKNETHFTGWNYERGQLEVTLGAGHPLDATFFVRALGRIEGFKNVSAERAGGDNTLRIRLTVEPS